ncbi:exonuclease SbcCD subunit D C-terminal domain-containing protein [Geminicoccus roseus]|uniref:exonuclease SbcCD subunit D C-terminal domain-containing protein n=1 Tax=Geminicoccus roseus TaxID=404900 RepID=UPI000406AE76|nr:exonuclease SbcCD subunit D C-terminal domain-containing protein [Geminicoccus roseus]
MRLIHTSDWHLGHEILGFDRGLEHDAFLDWLLDQVEVLGADVLLVTGDIYDSVNPSTAAQRRFYRFVARVLDKVPGLQLLLTGGNHDSPSRLELPADLLDAQRVAIMGSVPRTGGRPDPARLAVPLRDRGGAIRAVCAAIPYLRPGDLPDDVGGDGPVAELHRQAVAAADAMRGDLPLVVTGHLHVSGGEVSDLSERRVLIGGAEVVPASVYPAHAAYVALGHLHRPQQIKGPTAIRYAGSPFPLSVTERDYRHGIVVVDLDGGGEARIETVQAPRTVPFLRVPRTGAVPLDQVEAALRELSLEDPGPERRAFLEVAVRLDGPEPDLRRRIEQALDGKPVRLVRVAREVAAAAPGGGQVVPAELAELAEIEVFQRMHAQEHGGHPPAEDLLQAFRQLLSDVRDAEGREAAP